MLMAQALLDLTYYKCGHCQKKFNSLAAFGKHQKEVHAPKNAPRNSSRKEEVDETIEKQLLSGDIEFVLKVKLCSGCSKRAVIDNNLVLQIPMCHWCLQKNGFV